MATDGIAFAGSIIVDNVKTVESWPERGMLSRILRTERSLGGLVPNTAIYLKTLDPSIPVSAIGCVGTDEPGKFALSTLSSHGIDVSRVRKIDCPTSFTDVMTLAKTGERTFFNMHGADSLLRPEDVVSPVAGASMVHLGYLLLLDSMDEEDDEYGTAAARLLARLKADGMKTSIDIVSENTPRFAKVVRPALKYCDYLIVNEIEGSLATGIDYRDGDGCTTPERLNLIAEKLFELGVKEKVVLHCPTFGFARDASGKTATVPSLKLPDGWIKGTVGAGDAFCAAMLYGIFKGMSDEESLRLASCTAAANLSSADSLSGAMSLEETMALEGKFGRLK
jgi:sugar/nucleoside kinase (ribokinase family)